MPMSSMVQEDQMASLRAASVLLNLDIYCRFLAGAVRGGGS